MFRYTCPSCSTVTFFREGAVARQTWCPNCQSDVRVQARPADAKSESSAGSGARAALKTSLLALPLLGIVAWALCALMPATPLSPEPPPPDSQATAEAGYVPRAPHLPYRRCALPGSFKARGG